MAIASAEKSNDGWLTLELAFESFKAARDRLLAFGRGVKVIEPDPLRRRILDFAEQIVALYKESQ